MSGGTASVFVELREVCGANVRAVCELELAPRQETYVAPASFTVAESAYEPNGILRAIYVRETDAPVGVLFVDPSADGTSALLVRLLIDAGSQRRGVGTATMRALTDLLRAQGFRELLTSYQPGPEEPRDFYLGFGFQPTGELNQGEEVLRLKLA